MLLVAKAAPAVIAELMFEMVEFVFVIVEPVMAVVLATDELKVDDETDAASTTSDGQLTTDNFDGVDVGVVSLMSG